MRIRILEILWKLFLKFKYPSCNLYGKRFGKKVHFEKGVTVEWGSYVHAHSIGKYTYINSNCIVSKNVKSIGRFCSIAYSCKIGLKGHPLDWVTTHKFVYDKRYKFIEKSHEFWEKEKEKYCTIGNDVWIGANAIILAGVNIGDGAIIGANSLVKDNVKPYSIVAGSPAKHIRYRLEKDQIDILLKSKWWDWDENFLKENIGFMRNPETFISKVLIPMQKNSQ